MADKDKPIILTPEQPLDEAVDIFMTGGIIAYPTETFYGLGVDPFNTDAVERLFLLKGRSFKNPIPLIVKDRPMLERVAKDVPSLAEKLIKRFWPGPLTIIFNASSDLPSLITAGRGRVGVRVSSGSIAQKLLSSISSPITATSANPSGKEPAATGAEVIDYFKGSIDALIDGGELHEEKGSTIVEITGEGVELVREGVIPFSEIIKI